MANIYVGNLSYHTTEADLEAAFGAFGVVDRVSIGRDRDTGQPRGFAFVEMSDKAAADKAIEGLNGQEMQGRALTVNEARPKPDRGSGGGNRFGNRGGGGRPPREPRW